MKHFFVYILFVLLLLPSPLVASAENFVFATFQFPPLEYVDEDGTPKGLAVEIVTRIMERLGHTVEIQFYPWPRALKMTKNGEVDAIFTAYKNPEREKFLDYSKQVLIPQIVYLYAKKGRDISFNGDLLSLDDKIIGVTSTISYGQVFDKVRPQLQVERTDKLESNFQKLIKERLDLVISNIYVADDTLRKLGLKDSIIRLSPEIERVPSYIGFSKKQGLKQLRDQFDRELLKMKQQGEYTELMGKYGIDSP